MNPQDKKAEINYERQYSQVIELKAEIQKVLEINLSSLSSSLSSKSLASTSHIEQLISTIEKNKASIHSNIIALCTALSEKMSNRIESLHSLQSMYLASLQKSKLLIKGKNKYKECNLMKKSEMLSIQYEISQLTHRIKDVQLQSSSLEVEIANLKKDNKNSYITEISLLEQVMSFDKRLYTVFNAREGLMKQKQQIQNEISQREMQLKKQIAFQTQIRIKAITKQINECNNALSLVIPIQKSWSLKISESKALEKYLSDYYQIASLKGVNSGQKDGEAIQLSPSLHNESNRANETLREMLSDSMNQFPFLMKAFPSADAKEAPSRAMSCLLNEMKKCIADKKAQASLMGKNIGIAKGKAQELQQRIGQAFYRKQVIHKIMNALKENYTSLKSEKQKKQQQELIEKERLNKIAQIKQKEAQLIKELEMQKEKEALRLMDLRKEKAEKKPKKGKKKEREKSKDPEANSDEDSTTKKDKSIIRNISIPQVPNSTHKNSYIAEIEKLEKTFHSTNPEQINFDNLSFIDELSKNIQEVNTFHQKSIFGDKKNKYSKYDFSYI